MAVRRFFYHQILFVDDPEQQLPFFSGHAVLQQQAVFAQIPGILLQNDVFLGDFV